MSNKQLEKLEDTGSKKVSPLNGTVYVLFPSITFLKTIYEINIKCINILAFAFRYSAQVCHPCSHPSIMNILCGSFCAYRKYSSIFIRGRGRNVHTLVAVAGLSFNIRQLTVMSSVY